MNKYLNLTLKIGLYLFIFMASMIVFSIIGMIFGVIIFGIDALQPPMIELMPITVLMGSIGTLFAIFIFWLMLKNKEKDIISLCKFDKISLKSGLLMIPITIGFSAFTMIYFALVYKYDLVPGMEVYMEMMQGLMETIPGIVSISIAAIIVAPIAEEILFRGLIFNFLREKISLKYSIIIQALLFGIIHLNVFQGFSAFVYGILLAYIYIWTKSIWSVIIIHFLNNLLAVASMLLYDPDMTKYVTGFDLIILGIIGFVIIIPSLWLLYKDNIKKPTNKLELV